VAVRIIHVAHRQSWSIDRQVVDAVGSRYMLDPGFFAGHLDHYYASKDSLCRTGLRGKKRTWVERLPSEKRVIEGVWNHCGFAGVVLPHDNEEADTTEKGSDKGSTSESSVT